MRVEIQGKPVTWRYTVDGYKLHACWDHPTVAMCGKTTVDARGTSTTACDSCVHSIDLRAEHVVFVN